MLTRNLLNSLIALGLVLLVMAPVARAQYWIEFQAIVQLDPGVDIDSFATANNLTVVDSITFRNLAVFRSNTYMPTEELLLELNGMEGVVYAEPHLITEDPESQQKSEGFVDMAHPDWDEGVSPELYFSQSARGQINLYEAHGVSTGSGTVVAVLDNGVDFSHPALDGNFASDPYIAYDYVDDDLDPSEEPGGDAYGHGTFVSSMIRVVAPDAAILPLRVLDETGQGSIFDVVEAIYYAASLGVDVINLSLGASMESQTLSDAVTFADSVGVCCVASVGNRNSEEESYPAACDLVPGITAVDSNDVKAEFATFGDWIALSAPGVELYGALADEEFGWWSGTSFSSALVTGTVALLRSAKPALSPEAIRGSLECGADNIDDQNPGFEGKLGSGRLNCYSALLAASSGGDVDGNGAVDIDDVAYLLNYIFVCGPAPEPVDVGDADCSGSIDIDDAVYLIGYIFSGGSAPNDIDGDGAPDC